MSAQTTISADPALAYSGMVSEVWDKGIYSYVAEVSITTGFFVIRGTADQQCKLPGAQHDIDGGPALGIAVYDPSLSTNWPSGQTVPYAAGVPVAVLRRGCIWVVVEEAVSDGDPVYVRITANTGPTRPVGGLGASTTDSGKTELLPNARFRTTQATAFGLALVEINLPG